MIIPSLVMGIIFLMPIVGRWKLGHWFNMGLSWSILAGVCLLTYLAMTKDERNPDYKAAVQEAARNAARVKTLDQAPTGIPSSGAAALLRADPLTQGPKIFSRNCASCHRFDGHDGTGKIPKDPQAASDLFNMVRFRRCSRGRSLSTAPQSAAPGTSRKAKRSRRTQCFFLSIAPSARLISSSSSPRRFLSIAFTVASHPDKLKAGIQRSPERGKPISHQCSSGRNTRRP